MRPSVPTSELCEYCQRIFDQNIAQHKCTNHHNGIRDMIESSSRGCRLCGLILSKFSAEEYEMVLKYKPPPKHAMPAIYFQVGVTPENNFDYHSIDVDFQFQLPGGGSGGGKFTFVAISGTHLLYMHHTSYANLSKIQATAPKTIWWRLETDLKNLLISIQDTYINDPLLT